MRSNGADPHRVLGVPLDATEAEIKRAYRSLAKRHHPDAGQGSLDRFLAIQAAYEELLGSGPGGASARGWATRPGRAPRRPAQPADPARGGSAGGEPGAGTRDPRARGASPGTEWARRPRGGSARRADAGGPAGPGTGPSTAGRAGFGAGTSAGARSGTSGGVPGTGEAGGRPRTEDPARGRRPSRRRATLGSTSYDGAEEAFEPDWRGASWYGPTSGTYWTINPKEYADPRKHGPEYQARARRGAAPSAGAADGAPGAPAPAEGAGEPGALGSNGRSAPSAGSRSAGGPDAAGDPNGAAGDPGAAGAPDAAGGQARSGRDVDDLPPSWRAQTWTAAAHPAAGRAAFEHEPIPGAHAPGQQPGERPDPRSTGVGERPGQPRAGQGSPTGGAISREPWAVPPATPGGSATGRAADEAAAVANAGPGVAARVVLALLGWAVPGLALAALAGIPGALLATLPLQAAGVAMLALVPRAAWVSIGGSVVLVFAAFPIVGVVAALGGRFVPGGPAPGAAVVLPAAAWILGAFLVGTGRVAPYPWRQGR